jgi:hypothetical protein
VVTVRGEAPAMAIGLDDVTPRIASSEEPAEPAGTS